MRPLVLLLALLGMARAEPTVAPTEDRSWHLLQEQYDGLIRSIQHGLTKHECEFARARIMGEPATDEEKAIYKARTEAMQDAWDKWKADHGCDPKDDSGGTSGPSYKAKGGTCMRGEEFPYPGEGWHTVQPGDIRSAECFQ